MHELTVDVAIIGAGTAGLEAYKVAKEQGLKPVLIDKGPIGTTSIRTGCIPTQILHELSININKVETPASITRYGKSPEARVSRKNLMQLLRSQKRSFIEDFVKNIYTIPETERLQGEAHFIDAYHLAVNDNEHLVTAASFIIATGSTPYVPSEYSAIKDRLLTTDNIFDLAELPKSMAIVGSGSVGLEIGQIMTSLGVRTPIFGRKALWNFTDQKVASEAYEALRSRIFLTMNSSITDFEQTDEGLSLYYLDESVHECLLNVDYLFCATGRIPNLATLNMTAAGIEIGSDGMPIVNRRTMQSNVEHIFFAGDACEFQGTLQKAVRQGRVAGINASRRASGLGLELNEQPPMQVIFTNPQFAMVGRTYAEVNAQARNGEKYIVGEGLVCNNLKAQIENNRSGLIHTYFSHQTGALLGAEICCPDAAAICQFLASAIASGKTLKDLVDMSFYHPPSFEVLSESIADAAHKYRLLVKQQVK